MVEYVQTEVRRLTGKQESYGARGSSIIEDPLATLQVELGEVLMLRMKDFRPTKVKLSQAELKYCQART